jgi:hypothetical protein
VKAFWGFKVFLSQGEKVMHKPPKKPRFNTRIVKYEHWFNQVAAKGENQRWILCASFIHALPDILDKLPAILDSLGGLLMTV